MVIIVLATNRKQYHHVTSICIISPLQVRPSYCKRNPSGQPYKWDPMVLLQTCEHSWMPSIHSSISI